MYNRKIEEYRYLTYHEDYKDLNINQKIQAKNSYFEGLNLLK